LKATASVDDTYSYGKITTAAEYYPFAVLQSTSTAVDTTLVSGIVANYTTMDDVFTEAFTAGCPKPIELISGIYFDVPTSAMYQALSGGFSASAILQVAPSPPLAPGPYFISNTDGIIKFYKAYRLYSDTQRV
jgi:hypothetical protein